MTTDRAQRALSKALKDMRHARAMGELAFSEAARKRHARRERIAASRARDARRWIAGASCLLEA